MDICSKCGFIDNSVVKREVRNKNILLCEKCYDKFKDIRKYYYENK